MIARKHTCHAERCETPVPPAMFMCRRHWYMLTASQRDEVWSVYVPGQEQRMDPSDEYLAVTSQIIAWLSAKEAGLSR